MTTNTGQEEAAPDTWTAAERTSYAASLALPTLQSQEAARQFLRDVIGQLPLPQPWLATRSSKGKLFFANTVTNETTWKHPLEQVLVELATICSECAVLPDADRDTRVRALHAQWTAEAQGTLVNWSCGEEEGSGRVFYCNVETGETTWDSPLDPAYNFRLETLAKLVDSAYVAQLARGGAAEQGAADKPRPGGAQDHPGSPTQKKKKSMLGAALSKLGSSTGSLGRSGSWGRRVRPPDVNIIATADADGSGVHDASGASNAAVVETSGAAEDSAGGGQFQNVWTEQERVAYVDSMGLPAAPAQFLRDIIAGLPLLWPWDVTHDSEGRPFFVNHSTGATSWKHPDHEHALVDVARACQECIALQAGDRRARVQALYTTWSSEADAVLANWATAADADGEPYYYHIHTSESTREDPRHVILPAFQFKLDALARLLNEEYVATIAPAAAATETAAAAAPSRGHAPTMADVARATLAGSLESAAAAESHGSSQPRRGTTGRAVFKLDKEQPGASTADGAQSPKQPRRPSARPSAPAAEATASVARDRTSTTSADPAAPSGAPASQASTSYPSSDVQDGGQPRKQGGAKAANGSAASQYKQLAPSEIEDVDSPVKGQIVPATEKVALGLLGQEAKRFTLSRNPWIPFKSSTGVDMDLNMYARELGSHIDGGSSIDGAIVEAAAPALRLPLPIPWEVRSDSGSFVFVHPGFQPPKTTQYHPLHNLHSEIIKLFRNAHSDRKDLDARGTRMHLKRLVEKVAGHAGRFGTWEVSQAPAGGQQAAAYRNSANGHCRNDDPRLAAASEVGIALSALKVTWEVLHKKSPDLAEAFPFGDDEMWHVAEQLGSVICTPKVSRPRPPVIPPAPSGAPDASSAKAEVEETPLGNSGVPRAGSADAASKEEVCPYASVESDFVEIGLDLDEEKEKTKKQRAQELLQQQEIQAQLEEEEMKKQRAQEEFQQQKEIQAQRDVRYQLELEQHQEELKRQRDLQQQELQQQHDAQRALELQWQEELQQQQQEFRRQQEQMRRDLQEQRALQEQAGLKWEHELQQLQEVEHRQESQMQEELRAREEAFQEAQRQRRKPGGEQERRGEADLPRQEDPEHPRGIKEEGAPESGGHRIPGSQWRRDGHVDGGSNDGADRRRAVHPALQERPPQVRGQTGGDLPAVSLRIPPGGAPDRDSLWSPLSQATGQWHCQDVSSISECGPAAFSQTAAANQNCLKTKPPTPDSPNAPALPTMDESSTWPSLIQAKTKGTALDGDNSSPSSSVAHDGNLSAAIKERQERITAWDERGTGAFSPTATEDADEEDAEACELTFKGVRFKGLDHAAFKRDLLDSFRAVGALEAVVARLRVDLREGSTIALVRGPRAAMRELKDLPLANIQVMGCRPKLTSGFPPGLAPSGAGEAPATKAVDNRGDTDIGALRAEFREFLEAQRAKEEQERERDSLLRSEHYQEAAQLCARHDQFRKEQEEENCRLRDRACLQEERQAEESVLHAKICHAMQEEMSAERCLLRGEIQQVVAEAKEERERRVTSARLRGEREAEEAWQRREREKNAHSHSVEAQPWRLEEARQQGSSLGSPPTHGELPLPAESRPVREPFSPLFQQEKRRQQQQRSARLRGEWEAERKSLHAQLARLHEEQQQEAERSVLRSEVSQALAAQTLRTTLTQHREEEEQKRRQQNTQLKSEWEAEWRSLRGEWDAERSSLRAELGQLQEALLRQEECAEEELNWRRLVSRSPSPSRLHSSLSPVPAGMRRAAPQQAAQGEDFGFESSLPSRAPWLPSIPQPFQGKRWARGGDATGSGGDALYARDFLDGNSRRWQAERTFFLDEFHRAMDAQQLEASEMQRKEEAAEEQRLLKSARRKEEWASEWASMKGEIFDLMKVHHEQTFHALQREEEAHSHQNNAELEQERQGNRTEEEDLGEDLEEDEDQEGDVTIWRPGDTQVVVRPRSRPPVFRHSDQRLSMVAVRQREQDHAPLDLQPWSQPRQRSRPKSGGTTRTAHQRLSERPPGLHRMDSLPPGLAEQVLEEQRKQLMREQWPMRATRPQRRARSVVQLRPATSSGSDHRVVTYGLQEPWSQASKRRVPTDQPHLQRGLPCLQSSPTITQDRWGDGVRPRSAVPTRSR